MANPIAGADPWSRPIHRPTTMMSLVRSVMATTFLTVFIIASAASAADAQQSDEATDQTGTVAVIEGTLHAEIPGLAQLITTDGLVHQVEPGGADLVAFSHQVVTVSGRWQGEAGSSVFLAEAVAPTGDTESPHIQIDVIPTLAEERALLAQAEARQLGHNQAFDTAQRQAAVDSHVTGQWGPVQNWPVIPVFTSLLHDGRVLAFDSVGDGPTEDYPMHNFTRATVWDPAAGSFLDVRVNTGFNIFCAGFATLINGELFVAGGNANADLDGIVATHTFTPDTNRWTNTDNMNYARWYPSVTPLANGEMLITGGGPAVSEVRETDGRIRQLTSGARNYWADRNYPWLQAAPNGDVAFLGPSNQVGYVSTDGTGDWRSILTRDSVYRSYGSYAMYDIGRVLIAGGGKESSAHSQRSSLVVDLNTDSRSTTGSMANRRRQHNLTVLPDGKVLATGGIASNANLVDLNNAVYAAELWDPSTGQWQTLAAESRARQYHSTALLLPDATVLSAGGGVCGDCQRTGYIQKNGQIFSPPYLFKQDGSGERAPRPQIDSAPGTVNHGSSFVLTTGQAQQIDQVTLVRTGSATHGQNMEQRRVPLTFSRESGRLRVNAPANANIAPPGHYMLFIIDDDGVPSVADMVQVIEGSTVEGRITGRAVTGAGDPVADVAVDLFNADRTSWLGGTVTAADGTFTFDADPGCYQVTLVAPGGADWTSGRYHTDSVCLATDGSQDTEVEAVLLTPGDGMELGGTATDRADQSSVGGVAVDLFRSNTAGDRLGYLRSAVTGGDGRYRFGLAEAGCYALTFIAPDGYRFTSGNPQYQNQAYCLGDGQSMTDANVSLQGVAATASITGTVTDGADESPVSGVVIDLFDLAADGSRGAWLGDVVTGADGRFEWSAGIGQCYQTVFIAPTDRQWTATGTRWKPANHCPDTAGQTITADGRLAP